MLAELWSSPPVLPQGLLLSFNSIFTKNSHTLNRVPDLCQMTLACLLLLQSYSRLKCDSIPALPDLNTAVRLNFSFLIYHLLCPLLWLFCSNEYHAIYSVLLLTAESEKSNMHTYVEERQREKSYFAYPYSKGIRSSRSSVTLLLLEVPSRKFSQLT